MNKTVLVAYILTASFLQTLIEFWNREAVWLIFIFSSIVCTLVRDLIDQTKTVTFIKVLWSILTIAILCGLLRIYQSENGLSKFVFYLLTVAIGAFAPSAVYKILQNSDKKAEKGFAKIINAFFTGLEFRIYLYFGLNKEPSTDEPEEEEEEPETDLKNGE